MGARHQFVCECGYDAIVSNGRDRGLFIWAEPMICADCREVRDVAVEYITEGLEVPEGELDPDDLGRCPKCNGRNVTTWPQNRPCPRCGKPMTNEGAIGIWD